MHATNDLSLDVLFDGSFEGNAQPGPIARLLHRETAVAQLDCTWIIGQFRMNDNRRLLLTAQDTVPQETVEVRLLSEELTQLECHAVGGLYADGDVDGIVAEGPRRLRFRFLGCNWQVEVFGERRRFRPATGLTLVHTAETWLRPRYMAIRRHLPRERS